MHGCLSGSLAVITNNDLQRKMTYTDDKQMVDNGLQWPGGGSEWFLMAGEWPANA